MATGQMILDAVNNMTPEKRVGILQLLCPEDSAAAMGRLAPHEALRVLQDMKARDEEDRTLDQEVIAAEKQLDMEMFKAEHALNVAHEEEGDVLEGEGGDPVDLAVQGKVELIEVTFVADPDEGSHDELGLVMKDGTAPAVLENVEALAYGAGVRSGDTVLGFGGNDVHTKNGNEVLALIEEHKADTDADGNLKMVFLFGRAIQGDDGPEGQCAPNVSVKSWTELYETQHSRDLAILMEDLGIGDKNTRLFEIQKDMLSQPRAERNALKQEADQLDDEIQALTNQAKTQTTNGVTFEGGSSRSLTVSYEESDTVAVPPRSSLLNPRPDIEKLEAIVAKLDTSQDGTIEAAEVKVLFAKLAGLPVEQIPDDHEEVVAFAGLSNEELAAKLFETVAKEKVDQFYAALCQEGLQEEPAAQSGPEVVAESLQDRPLSDSA